MTMYIISYKIYTFIVLKLTLASTSSSENNICICIDFNIFVIIKATYLVIDLILSMLEIRPKVDQYDGLFKIKHCDKYDTIYAFTYTKYVSLYLRVDYS